MFSLSASNLGAILGRGSYFANGSFYSAKFSPANARGHKYMIQAAVIIGDYCLGKKEMVEAPYKANTMEQYDSVVDDMNAPLKFVVFEDSSAYPEYVIKFQ